jgi:hypothetical protein
VALVKVLFWSLLGRTEENYENLGQDSWSRDRVSNLVISEYRPEAVLLEPSCSVLRFFRVYLLYSQLITNGPQPLLPYRFKSTVHNYYSAY